MPSIVHMMAAQRRTFSYKVSQLETAKFILPLETRITPIQCLSDQLNPKQFYNMTFNLTTQVNVRFNPETTLSYFK